MSINRQQRDTLHHLRTVGDLTQPDAARLYQIGRLAARIGELRGMGVAIEAPLVETLTGSRVAAYHLAFEGAGDDLAKSWGML